MLLRVIIVSLRNLKRHPVRTFLILQGVIWGTALGVFPTAIINGSMQQVEQRAAELGTDRLLLTQEHIEIDSEFDWELVQRLRREYGDRVKHLTGMAVLESPKYGMPVIATDAHALDARRQKIASGRFFTAAEVDQATPVCVMEHTAVGVLREGQPVGQQLDALTDRELRVIGVTGLRTAAKQGLDEFGYAADHPLTEIVDKMKEYVGVFEDGHSRILTSDNAIVVPHTLVPDARPQWIEMRADPDQIVPLRKKLQESLTAEGYTPVIYINAILPALYGETLSTFHELSRVVFVLCVCVGTSIVCAIMVLSVVDRQREIAIRRVEGARRWHIALQFVVETGTLCMVGGILGVPLGILLAILRTAIEPLTSVTWTFPALESAVIVLVVSLVGLLGGLLPAWRAMAVDPVEMLRYE